MNKYFINNEKVSEDVFFSSLEGAVRNEVEENYNDLLDECYEPVKIGCCEFYASQILKNCDPVAYGCGIDDFVDSQLSDYKYDLARGEQIQVDGQEFEIVEEEEE